MPVVYIDLLFFINFIIDFLLLSATAKISGAQPRLYRVLLGAFSGAVYAVCIFFPSLSLLYTGIAKLLVSLLLIWIVFGYRSRRKFLKRLLIFYLSNFIFGGCITGFFYFTGLGGKTGAILSNGSFYFTVSLPVLLITSLLAYLLTSTVVRRLRRSLQKQGLMGRMMIGYRKDMVAFDALIDTGNSLTDPMTGLPVCVVELSVLKPILPEGLYHVLSENDLGLVYDGAGEAWSASLRLIPFNAVGTENGMMIGFRPDFVKIESDGKGPRSYRCIIAVTQTAFKNTNGCRGIINPLLLEQEEMGK